MLRLTHALWKEARLEGVDIGISVFCPGPVETDFNQKAHVQAPLAYWTAKVAV